VVLGWVHRELDPGCSISEQLMQRGEGEKRACLLPVSPAELADHTVRATADRGEEEQHAAGDSAGP